MRNAIRKIRFTLFFPAASYTAVIASAARRCSRAYVAMHTRRGVHREDRAMLFIVNWTAQPEVERQAAERFLQTRGEPPDGIHLIGRWHAIGSIWGIAVCECDDVEPLARWALEWADIFMFDIKPAITDEQVGRMLAEHAQKP
ncbi:DUF3303 family protein [Caballeronia sp. LZ033]|uniref:DUF3303 domain-containing protein n=1 Tax=Caballeronia sp. LZ033 TaxID=3038566 RepID=UPI00286D3454|nr:DUF3303 family protein [Caballeronia sp. LZ033]